MCHHELWQTSVSHPFSFLNSSLGLAGGKHYQKISIPVFRVVLQNFAIPGYFRDQYLGLVVQCHALRGQPLPIPVRLMLPRRGQLLLMSSFTRNTMPSRSNSDLSISTLGTLMTSAAADVINHNGRKIGR